MPADTRYRPPTAVQTRTITLEALVDRLDPDHERGKHWEEFYANWYDGPFDRTIYGDPYHSGPYTGPLPYFTEDGSGDYQNASGQDYTAES